MAWVSLLTRKDQKGIKIKFLDRSYIKKIIFIYTTWLIFLNLIIIYLIFLTIVSFTIILPKFWIYTNIPTLLLLIWVSFQLLFLLINIIYSSLVSNFKIIFNEQDTFKYILFHFRTPLCIFCKYLSKITKYLLKLFKINRINSFVIISKIVELIFFFPSYIMIFVLYILIYKNNESFYAWWDDMLLRQDRSIFGLVSNCKNKIHLKYTFLALLVINLILLSLILLLDFETFIYLNPNPFLYARFNSCLKFNNTRYFSIEFYKSLYYYN